MMGVGLMIGNWHFGYKTDPVVLEHQQLLSAVEDARIAWREAWKQFERATGAEAIDESIYLLIAAEKRYDGLLRLAKKSQVHVG